MANSVQKLFDKKLEDVHSTLMEGYRYTQNFTAPLVGAEREAIKKELLSLMLPLGFRVGSGCIVDSLGHETGQIDGVIEEPFSISFPIATANNRLYLADTVAAAFEIKSDLSAQGNEAKKKVEEIRRLTRKTKPPSEDEIRDTDAQYVPTFIISYKGPKLTDKVHKKFVDPMNAWSANGLLILDQEEFAGRTPGMMGGWYEGRGKSQCILAFLCCVLETLKRQNTRPWALFDYQALLSSAADK